MVIWIIITLLLMMMTACFFRPGWSDPWGRRQPSQPCTSRTAVATSPTAFGSQRIWDTVFFFQIVVGYMTYFIEAKSLSCYPKIFSRLHGKRHVWKFWTFGFGFAQTTSGFPRSWQLWSVHPLISILIQWTKKDFRGKGCSLVISFEHNLSWLLVVFTCES